MLSSHMTATISYTVYVATPWVFCPTVVAVAVASCKTSIEEYPVSLLYAKTGFFNAPIRVYLL